MKNVCIAEKLVIIAADNRFQTADLSHNEVNATTHEKILTLTADDSVNRRIYQRLLVWHYIRLEQRQRFAIATHVTSMTELLWLVTRDNCQCHRGLATVAAMHQHIGEGEWMTTCTLKRAN